MMLSNVLYFPVAFTVFFLTLRAIMWFLNKYVLMDYDIDWSEGKGQCMRYKQGKEKVE